MSYLIELNQGSIKQWRVREPRPPFYDFQQVRTGQVKSKLNSNHKTAGTQANKLVGPSITLEGQWLAKAGFMNGKQFQIDVYKNTLVLTLEDEPT